MRKPGLVREDVAVVRSPETQETSGSTRPRKSKLGVMNFNKARPVVTKVRCVRCLLHDQRSGRVGPLVFNGNAISGLDFRKGRTITVSIILLGTSRRCARSLSIPARRSSSDRSLGIQTRKFLSACGRLGNEVSSGRPRVHRTVDHGARTFGKIGIGHDAARR